MALDKLVDSGQLNSDLTSVANAIRAKTGGSSQLVFPAEFVSEIGSITTGDSIDHEDIPEYVKAEALSVAERVKAHIQSDSIVFLAGSDAHQLDSNSNIVSGNLHAGQAMKALAYMLPLDFACYLGDYTDGSSTTTIEAGEGHITEISADIDEAFRGLPQFRTVGNHDPLGYSYNQNGEALTQAELYQMIGKYNADGTTVMGEGTPKAGYCYRDYAAKHLRVICLNTADTEISSQGSAEAMSNTQKTWFSNTMASTPSGYGLIILSHHPLDWGGVCAASNLVYDYVNGNSYNASYVLAFHGHTHCYKTDSLYRIQNSVGTPYNVKRFAVPNMCFVRNNEYGQNGASEYYGIEFGETTTYAKTAGTGEDTAFCVFVVNPTEQKVHAIHYGAGYDREVYWGTQAVAVSDVSLSAASGTLNPGGSVQLTATVGPSNATNKAVTWTSSNTSVATVVNGLVTAVAIGSATITVTTQDGGYTATYALTVEAVPQGNLVNQIGYTDGVRLSTSNGAEKSASGYTTVGYIDLSSYRQSDNSVTIRTRGVDFQQRSSPYNDNAYAFYNGSQGFTVSSYMTAGSNAHGGITITRSFSGTEMTLTITGLTAALASDSYHYLRFCGLGTGADLDIRINENFS